MLHRYSASGRRRQARPRGRLLPLLAVLLGMATRGGLAQSPLDDLSHLPRTGPKHWALLIGVGAYQKATPLPNTVNDVLQISDVLRYRGNYHGDNVMTLVDQPEGEAAGDRTPTQANMTSAIEHFMTLPEPGDTVFVYFSGHGFRAADGVLYLAPLECDPKDPTAAGVKAQWVREQLAACKAHFKLLVLDACHAGSEKSDAEGDSIASGDLGNVFSGLEGVATIASSKADEKSLMWDEKQQSLFSYWLTQALKGHADRDNNGTVTFDELYGYVHAQVARTAELKFGRPQTPVRIVRVGTIGDPGITILQPQSLKAVLAEMAEQISWALESDRLTAVGVLEFTGESDQVEVLGGDFGLLGAYCAEEINNCLATLGAGRYSVVDPKRLLEVLAKEQFQLADLASTKSLESLAKNVGDMPAIIRGRIYNRQGCIVHLRASVVRTGEEIRSAEVGGVAALNESEWAMLGRSAAVEPGDRTPQRDPETGDTRPIEDTVVENLDDNADEGNPMLGDDFPFRIRVMVEGKERSPVAKGPDLYVSLSPGETYQIWIDYRDVGESADQAVYMRLLVDGLNTQPRKLKSKGVETWEWAKRENLAEANYWVLDPAKQRVWAVKGFYTRYGTGNDTYKQFQVVGASESLAARQQFASEIGLITAAFYTRSAGARTGEVGTAAGEEHSEQIGLYQGGGAVGNLLGVIHLRYDSPEVVGGM